MLSLPIRLGYKYFRSKKGGLISLTSGIAITALARFIILQDKESDPTNLIYISTAILIVAIATVIIRLRNSKYLKIDNSKSNEL